MKLTTDRVVRILAVTAVIVVSFLIRDTAASHALDKAFDVVWFVVVVLFLFSQRFRDRVFEMLGIASQKEVRDLYRQRAIDIEYGHLRSQD